VADGSGFETNWRGGKADRDRTMFTSDENVDPCAAGEDSMANVPTHASAYADQSHASKFPPTLVEFRTIDVELVWIRFELAGALKERPHEELATTTLSVCMVISWPRTSLVKHAAEFPNAAEKLRLVIETFEDLRGREQVLGSRSCIEDGQFVGWLSYTNVVQAKAGFQRLRETLSAHDLRVSLRTRATPHRMDGPLTMAGWRLEATPGRVVWGHVPRGCGGVTGFSAGPRSVGHPTCRTHCVQGTPHTGPR